MSSSKMCEMYVDGVSFQICVDQFWLESIEVMLFCMTMNFKVLTEVSPIEKLSIGIVYVYGV